MLERADPWLACNISIITNYFKIFSISPKIYKYMRVFDEGCDLKETILLFGLIFYILIFLSAWIGDLVSLFFCPLWAWTLFLFLLEHSTCLFIAGNYHFYGGGAHSQVLACFSIGHSILFYQSDCLYSLIVADFSINSGLALGLRVAVLVGIQGTIFSLFLCHNN